MNGTGGSNVFGLTDSLLNLERSAPTFSAIHQMTE